MEDAKDRKQQSGGGWPVRAVLKPNSESLASIRTLSWSLNRIR